MGIRVSPGFTIIEVMLFLAVTGLMITGVMAGANSSLNAQRYRDGVEAIRNSISSEYAKVYSLTNTRESTDPCGGGGAASRLWGTSDCLYVGRLLQITQDTSPVASQKLTVYPVVATEVAADASDMIARYRFKKIAGEGLVESRKMEWGLTAVTTSSRSSTLAEVSILILRSPIDGSVRTYNLLYDPMNSIDDDNLNANMTPGDATVPGALSRGVEFCVADLDGPLDPATRQAIVIQKSATGPGDIESRMGNSEGGNPTC